MEKLHIYSNPHELNKDIDDEIDRTVQLAIGLLEEGWRFISDELFELLWLIWQLEKQKKAVIGILNQLPN